MSYVQNRPEIMKRCLLPKYPGPSLLNINAAIGLSYETHFQSMEHVRPGVGIQYATSALDR